MAAGRHFCLVRSMGYPPPGSVQLACQNDGAGPVWSAVAHTPWGDIPGKAIGGTCWFGYGGKGHETSSFSWVVQRNPTPMVLILSNGYGPPYNALKVGYQHDWAGELYAAVALTKWGTIPAKAKGKTCWYEYNTKEHETNQFYWVCHQ